MARGISVVLTAGGIIDTIVFGLGNLVSSLPPALTGIGMLIVQNVINLFIPSGSGQAVVTMPIMAPLADALGLTRDAACLAFQFGDGLSNLLWPTSQIMIVLGASDIPYQKWLKFLMPLFFILLAAQMVMLAGHVGLGLM